MDLVVDVYNNYLVDFMNKFEFSQLCKYYVFSKTSNGYIKRKQMVL